MQGTYQMLASDQWTYNRILMIFQGRALLRINKIKMQSKAKYIKSWGLIQTGGV
jgi:hypothetical protein